MPRYFIAVFGQPEPGKKAVESGIYTPDPRYAPFPAQLGDVMLLYCTGSYASYPMQVPGIGIVLRVDREHVEYRWLPLTEPLSKNHVDKNLDSDDAGKMRLIHLAPYWLFEISQQSFSKILGSRPIAWGKL
jgi:hypothetical protein